MVMKLMTPIMRSGVFILAALVSACGAHVPPEISQALAGSPGVAQVREAPDSYLSTKVRWGGTILSTENKLDTSWITILAYPLSESDGEPQTSDQSPGRFIAVVDKFLEPLIYGRDREITVIGSLTGTETLQVGEFPYRYPVIEVKQLYLWPEQPELSEYNYPYYRWHDPWYDPWYYGPYYPWRSPYYPYRYY